MKLIILSESGATSGGLRLESCHAIPVGPKIQGKFPLVVTPNIPWNLSVHYLLLFLGLTWRRIEEVEWTTRTKKRLDPPPDVGNMRCCVIYKLPTVTRPPDE